ncbi:hypothetical protein GN157_05505 [Flavobacterium rakeshii]|uniref:Uncharacterized protein n=1 Tax=Flavobacterium rakeshii TaxID=1038845 RepID=A0A6N8HBB5_9FLAO|nr:hypothetical protein [Flavobacterium rakeshii]MUV03160.1 hypothetical protein [Flavobacterium rakeshii]
MKKLILMFALMVSAIGFSKTGENELPKNFNDSQVVELIKSQLNIQEFSTSMYQFEIAEVEFDDVKPCKLTVLVEAKVIIEGSVAASVKVSGQLELEDCNDIGGMASTLIRGLIEEAIASLQKQLGN